MRAAITFAIVALFTASSLAAGADPLIPNKRLVLQGDTDFVGGDIASIFDITLGACQTACLANAACEAITYNTAHSSCFIKAGGYEVADYVGAISGLALQATAQAEDVAQQRREELGFLGEWEFPLASEQAKGLASLHIAGPNGGDEVDQIIRMAEEAGNYDVAAEYAGIRLAGTDLPQDWAEYARLSRLASDMMGDQQRAYQERSLWATINGYLRTDDLGLQHTLMVEMATTLEVLDRGRDMVKALRLAQALTPRDDTALMLQDAAGKYGFRIVETLVQSDLARPRICAVFSEELDPNLADYSPYLTARDVAITVATDGTTQICAEGLTHGARYALTFRAGLPAKDGQVLSEAVDITAYIRDRSPAVRFAGRGYVLPKGRAAALPVQTVNTAALALELYRVTDRNLVRVLQNGYLSAPLAEYQEYDFTSQIGAKLWQGRADVAQQVNVDVTTRLPLDAALAGQSAGIYALRASVPGADPYTVPAAWQWFVISDIGLTTLSGADGLHVFARALGDARALAGLDMQLVSDGNDVLASAVTDDQGYARFDAGLVRGTGVNAPAMVVARRDAEDLAFLSLKDAEFDLSDRGVAGRAAAPALDVFIATDRGAYRAGEVVHLTALARDGASAAVEGLPLTAVLKRPDGLEFSRQQVGDGGAGGYVFALPIAANAPHGQWRVDLLADLAAPPLASTTFLVADFLPERMDFTLALANAPLRVGDTAQVALEARYLFGAPAADALIEGEVTLQAASGLAEWPGYSFGRHDRPGFSAMETFAGVQTDAAGQALLRLKLPAAEAVGKPLMAQAVVRLADGAARPIERKLDLPLQANAPMIGIKPLFQNAAPEGGEARFALVALGAGGAVQAGPLTWVLTRVETEYQWYQQDGNWNWEPVTTRSKVAEGVANSTALGAEIAAPVTWGAFELAVTGPDGAAASITFDAGWYGGADVTATPDMLEMALDAPAYRAGDVAKLRLVPRADGVALVQVLSNRLIAMQAVPVKAGENVVNLPVTDEWGTGVYIAVSALHGTDVAKGRNPSRALGIAHASVAPGPRALSVQIEPQGQPAPRSPLEVAVKVSGGRAGEAAFVTLAAVDQGILNLTGSQPPDPSAHYFGQRKLGVAIRDLYGRLIDGMNGAMGVVRSGGDAGAGARLQAPPPTEELVAFFSGPIPVGPDGYARASFAMPSFNGTVKLMAIAWSKSAVGQGHADVILSDPVVLSAALPRFLTPGDSSQLVLDLHHASGAAGAVAMDISATGLILGDYPRSITLQQGGRAQVLVPLQADTTGDQAITIALTTPEGKALQKTLALPVQITDRPVQRISRIEMARGAEFVADGAMFDGFRPGTGRASLALGPVAGLANAGGQGPQPYECSEQIISAAMPLLYGSASANAQVKAAISAVLLRQNSNGAFGLWRVDGGGDMWLDAYVSDFLGRARAQGHNVPDPAYRSALDNLRNQVNYQPDFDQGGEALAYALMVLAREGAAAIGDLRYYADVKGDAFATAAAQAQLGAALASYGDQPRADAMFRRADTAALQALDQPEGQVWRADYGSGLRDAAVVLAMAGEAQSRAVQTGAILTRIAAQARPLSSQEQVWMALAARELAAAPVDFTVNGAPAASPTVTLTDNDPAPVAIANTGDDSFITLTTTGLPLGNAPSGGTGYAITRSYVSMTGEPVDLSSVKVGARMAVVLEITPFAEGAARLMVNDPLPAGFEIDNPSLIGSAQPALASLGLLDEVTQAEYRQDRFLAAVDRSDNQPFRLGYIVRAVSAGAFHHPAATVEDMYRPAYSGRSDAGRLVIAP